VSTDAGSTRVSIKCPTRTLVALLLVAATCAVGAAPAYGVTKDPNSARRTEIGRPARVVVNRVEQTMHDTMDASAFAVAVLDARQRAADAERLRAAVAWVTAVEAARAAKADRDAVWDRIAACETGGNWSMQGSSFSGGVGFANTTWSAFGGQEFASNAGLATRDQQIIVAERVRDYGGYSGWGCAYTIGLLSR